MQIRSSVLAVLLTLAAGDVGATQYSPVQRANALVAERRFDEAILALREYLVDRPDEPEILRQLGEVYLAAGLWDEAIETPLGSTRRSAGPATTV